MGWIWWWLIDYDGYFLNRSIGWIHKWIINSRYTRLYGTNNLYVWRTVSVYWNCANGVYIKTRQDTISLPKQSSVIRFASRSSKTTFKHHCRALGCLCCSWHQRILPEPAETFWREHYNDYREYSNFQHSVIWRINSAQYQSDLQPFSN